jgi:CBS domain-containing protein
MAITVKDIMSRPVLKVDVSYTVEAAGKLMAKARNDSILVVKKGKPIGIMTDSDLIKKVIAKNIKPSSIKIEKLMSTPLVSVEPETTVLEASRKMKRNNLKRLPVISNGILIGIISTTDIARTVPEMADILEFKLKTKDNIVEIKDTTSGICDSCENYSNELMIKEGQWLCEDCRQEIEED